MSVGFTAGEGDVHPPPNATNPKQPPALADITDSLATSCAIASQSPCIPGHLERKTDLRNDRFRMGNGRHLTNRISLIANCHRPLRLPYVCLESGARNSQRSDARRRHGVREFTKLRRPVKGVPCASSTKTHVVCDYTRKLIRTTERRTNLP